MRFRKPRAEPRRCSSRRLIVSVGPSLVPGRLKNAKTSPARLTIVRPSFPSSTRLFGVESYDDGHPIPGLVKPMADSDRRMLIDAREAPEVRNNEGG